MAYVLCDGNSSVLAFVKMADDEFAVRRHFYALLPSEEFIDVGKLEVLLFEDDLVVFSVMFEGGSFSDERTAAQSTNSGPDSGFLQ